MGDPEPWRIFLHLLDRGYGDSLCKVDLLLLNFHSTLPFQEVNLKQCIEWKLFVDFDIYF